MICWPFTIQPPCVTKKILSNVVYDWKVILTKFFIFLWMQFLSSCYFTGARCFCPNFCSKRLSGIVYSVVSLWGSAATSFCAGPFRCTIKPVHRCTPLLCCKVCIRMGGEHMTNHSFNLRPYNTRALEQHKWRHMPFLIVLVVNKLSVFHLFLS